jgi:glycolate oxidase FAD binding subunit
LGVKAVSGRGEAFKAGGRVVKNVTGYDLSRGLAGSFGTLAIATELTLRVLPRGESSATLILTGLDPAPAVKALCAAMGAPVDVSGPAHLTPYAAKTQGYSTSITALRLEGFAPSVTGRLDRLEAMFNDLAPMARLDAPDSQKLWRAIRDVALLPRRPRFRAWPRTPPMIPAAGIRPAAPREAKSTSPSDRRFAAQAPGPGGKDAFRLAPQAPPATSPELAEGADGSGKGACRLRKDKCQRSVPAACR